MGEELPWRSGLQGDGGGRGGASWQPGHIVSDSSVYSEQNARVFSHICEIPGAGGQDPASGRIYFLTLGKSWYCQGWEPGWQWPGNAPVRSVWICRFKE